MLRLSPVSGRLINAARCIGLHGSRWPASAQAVGTSLLSALAECRAHGRRSFASCYVRRQDVAVSATSLATDVDVPATETSNFAKSLPTVCPGCGAFSQTIEPDAPGFYSPKRQHPNRAKDADEDRIFRDAMARLAKVQESTPTFTAAPEIPAFSNIGSTCTRCHNLIHQSKGQSILHPSMQSIQSIIESSPHKNNHIYHVVDAADFPMSLIPNLLSALKLPRLRTQNRRSKSVSYSRDRVASVSFIITRADLLAPNKEQVDRLMPYLQEVLRDALGSAGRHVRLGNVRCVSAKRGWWTPTVKQEVWERGGAGWVVGKVNVGKSALFEVIFPKGRGQYEEEDAKLRAVRRASATSIADAADADAEELSEEISTRGDTGADSAVSAFTPTMDAFGEVPRSHAEDIEYDADENAIVDDESLLPPAQPEVQYPQMPIVSALPGTTASPIRIPYGNGKGELIDLPGVHRSSLETHVKPEWRPSLIMKSRIVPEQYTLKPGQSLLLGGLIRITPKTDELIFLAYPFTPLQPHITASGKAVAIQTGVNDDETPYIGNVTNIGTDTAKQRIISAGTFRLQWDVTKRRAGPLTDRTAGKQKAENLPFTVYSTDILIEGVGWVELVCQVRNRRKYLDVDAFTAGEDQKAITFPEVEIFSPKGKFIGVRRPMNAWLLGGPKKVAKHARRVRPRMSISMEKRKEGGRLGSQSVTFDAA